jgi:hypothetical protein
MPIIAANGFNQRGTPGADPRVPRALREMRFAAAATTGNSTGASKKDGASRLIRQSCSAMDAVGD